MSIFFYKILFDFFSLKTLEKSLFKSVATVSIDWKKILNSSSVIILILTRSFKNEFPMNANLAARETEQFQIFSHR